MRIPHLLPILAIAAALAGCSGMNRGGKWPTLAPRAGEVSPLVPRTPLGACAGCGQDVFPAAPEPVAVAPPPVTADVPARLDATEKAIAAVEAQLPALRHAMQAANAAARGSAGDSNAATEAEVQRSRFESAFLPLAVQARALDQIDDDVVDKAGAEPYIQRAAALRSRLAALDAERIAVVGD
ncbi:MAG: hypothetical protein ACOYLS_10330 [Polymorphobacter sp.]